MRKTGFFLMTALFAGLTMFTSCKKDNAVVAPIIPNAPLTTPAYESVSAKYVITGAGSQYKSVELTASGNYVIVKNGGSPSGVRRFLGRADETTRAASNNIIYGRFTKKSDTEFDLEGFGTIVIEGSSTDVISLKITPVGGTTVSLPAQRMTAIESAPDSFTSKLCRTWKVASYRYTILMNGAVFFDGEYATAAEINQALNAKIISMGYPAMDQSELVPTSDSESPDQIIFSKSGTYIVFYKNATLAVSTWSWKDEAKGVLHYSWDYDNPFMYDYSGNVQVSWRGSQLVITEEMNDPHEMDMEPGLEGLGFSMKFVTYLNEVR